MSFYNTVNALSANGGGDLPEYSVDAMLKGLQFKSVDDMFPVMIEGSQMIVITDATSKHRKGLDSEVIKAAILQEVCIHFFVARESATSDGVYQRIAKKTRGNLITPFSNWDIATFASSYRKSPCAFEVTDKRRKRDATTSGSKCHTFHVSKLSILFRFSGETSSSVTFTRPSGTTFSITSRAGVAVHSERSPEPGEWLVCLSSGSSNFFVDQDYLLDATLAYLKKTDSGSLVASINPPVECKCYITHMSLCGFTTCKTIIIISLDIIAMWLLAILYATEALLFHSALWLEGYVTMVLYEIVVFF